LTEHQLAEKSVSRTAFVQTLLPERHLTERLFDLLFLKKSFDLIYLRQIIPFDQKPKDKGQLTKRKFQNHSKERSLEVAVILPIFFTECHLTKTPFNRTLFDWTPFDLKIIWPKFHLGERRLTERLFDRKLFLMTLIVHLTERSFDQKCFRLAATKKIGQTNKTILWNEFFSKKSFD
jgi:hypothetical protein